MARGMRGDWIREHRRAVGLRRVRMAEGRLWLLGLGQEVGQLLRGQDGGHRRHTSRPIGGRTEGSLRREGGLGWRAGERRQEGHRASRDVGKRVGGRPSHKAPLGRRPSPLGESTSHALRSRAAGDGGLQAVHRGGGGTDALRGRWEMGGDKGAGYRRRRPEGQRRGWASRQHPARWRQRSHPVNRLRGEMRHWYVLWRRPRGWQRGPRVGRRLWGEGRTRSGGNPWWEDL